MPATLDSTNKSGLIESIWKLLESLTAEARDAAVVKCKENELDPEAGVVSLDESYINLADAKLLLKDSIESRKLIQLPITVQRKIKAILDNIVKFQTELANGEDQVSNLTGAIEQLHYELWASHLGQMSDQLVAYETKANQLKTLRRETTKLKDDLSAGLELKKSVEELLSDLAARRDGLDNEIKKATDETAALTKNATITQKLSQEADAKLRTILQSETAAAESLARIKSSHSEATKLEEGLSKFFQKVDDTRTKITKMDEDAQATVTQQKGEVDKLVARLAELESKIADQIEKATGFSLFDSFLKRRDALARTKYIWAVASLGALAGLIGLTFLLTSTPMDLNHVFWFRLAIAIPLGFALYFCTSQYKTERRLEEEYNFRANISTSLVPYKEIVKDLASEEEYAKFMIATIEKVFTSPTERVFAEAENNQDLFSEKNAKKVDTFLGTIRKHLNIPGLPAPAGE